MESTKISPIEKVKQIKPRKETTDVHIPNKASGLGTDHLHSYGSVCEMISTVEPVFVVQHERQRLTWEGYLYCSTR